MIPYTSNTSPTVAKHELFFLILSCSGGAGHLRAADALHKTASQCDLPIRTEHFDVLDFTTKLFKRFYSESYVQMVNRAPELWGYLYQQSEKKPYRKQGLVKAFDQINYRRYLRTLQDVRPDAVLCTHFLPYISISQELQKNKITSPFYSVTTDFDIHQLWIDPIIKRYFVFHEESAWQLHSKHVPEDKIKITGIPIMPEFTTRTRTAKAREKLGILKNNFTILSLSGGLGMGKVTDIVEQIVSTLTFFPNKKFNLVVVCGKNERVRAQMQALSVPPNIELYIHGFINNIHDFMDAADILISKAGGLTSSEALAKSLPMLIIDPIPGQESRNTDLIVEHQAGWKAINLANLSYKLSAVIKTPALLTAASTAAQHLAKPHAARTILSEVYNQLCLKKRLSR